MRLFTPTNLGKGTKMAFDDDTPHNMTPVYNLELQAELNATPHVVLTPSYQKFVASICNNSATKSGTDLWVVTVEPGVWKMGGRWSFTKRLWHATLSEFSEKFQIFYWFKFHMWHIYKQQHLTLNPTQLLPCLTFLSKVIRRRRSAEITTFSSWYLQNRWSNPETWGIYGKVSTRGTKDLPLYPTPGVSYVSSKQAAHAWDTLAEISTFSSWYLRKHWWNPGAWGLYGKVLERRTTANASQLSSHFPDRGTAVQSRRCMPLTLSWICSSFHLCSNGYNSRTKGCRRMPRKCMPSAHAKLTGNTHCIAFPHTLAKKCSDLDGTDTRGISIVENEGQTKFHQDMLATHT